MEFIAEIWGFLSCSKETVPVTASDCDDQLRRSSDFCPIFSPGAFHLFALLEHAHSWSFSVLS